MSNVGKKAKKVCNAFAMVIIFLIMSLLMIFIVEVGINYYETGKITYKVVPVTTIEKVVNHFNDEDLAKQEGAYDNNDGDKAAAKTTSDDKSADDKTSDNDKSEDDNDKSLTKLVDNIMPSIVAINCTVETTSGFGWYGNNTTQSTSSGSGIIIAQNSYEVLIVTNNHVVSGAKSVEVVFNDGQSYKASIKGCDETSDLAVVAVSGNDISDDTLSNIKIASLGNSESLVVGDTAIAIGNSMGYGQSVTKGVISALNRSLATEDYSMELIQTDAAINPGNSGGALLNARGEVIGINSVKYVSTDTESIGYAIPISDALPIINDLINNEEVSEDDQAYFGIVAYTVSSQMSEYLDCPLGISIKSVAKDSPADTAGIVSGDIITEFAGRKIKSMEEFQDIIKYKRQGQECEVVFSRLENGKYVDHKESVTLTAKPDDESSDQVYDTDGDNDNNTSDNRNFFGK